MPPAGTGGLGLLPKASFSQPSRVAVSHAAVVHTPDVRTNFNTLSVLVQLYDEYGNSHVSGAGLSITASLPGAPSQVLPSAYNSVGPTGRRLTRRYSIALPSVWFDVAEPSGTVATVTTSLSGHGALLARLHGVGTPAWFSARRTSAGIAVYATSDPAGAIPAETMQGRRDLLLAAVRAHRWRGHDRVRSRAGRGLQRMRARAGERRVRRSVHGPPRGDLSGTYQTEVLQRIQNPSGRDQVLHQVLYLQKLTPLQATRNHLGYLEMRLLGSGTYLTSAAVGTAFYFDGGTAFIAGVSAGRSIDVYGNAPQVQLDAPVGVLSHRWRVAAPVVNTGYLTGTDVSVSVLALLTPRRAHSAAMTPRQSRSQARSPVPPSTPP